ncbi:MAG: ATP-binding cassette domain-containing protein [Nitrospinae bacterium]|nr:ATP-binding cassette domain-containing protein [Nitrospinota bacterium]
MTHSFLEVKDLKKYYHPDKPFLGKATLPIRAVDGISFTLQEGETLGLVGESGSGKSTAARTLLRLEIPTSGSVHFKGQNLADLKETEIRDLRKEMQMIFQDPFSSINPRRKIADVLREPFEIHGFEGNISETVKDLLNQVGLSPDHSNRYPHEMSGGQLQRVGIARAIALNPSLIVADEPVSALDVSVQAQVVNLMMDLRDKLGMSYLFISHDMGIVEYFCDRVAVMYLGKIVEFARSEEIYKNPGHPYTEALLNAIPGLDSEKAKPKIKVHGDIPDPSNPPQGCSFHTRCPLKEKQCEEMEPALKEVAPGHFLACFLKE